MNFLLRLDTWIVLIGAALLIRHFMMIMAAEQGRQHDLVKKRYQKNFENNLSIIIPYTRGDSYENLHKLLAAIEEQDYPRNRVSVMIGAAEALYDDLECLPVANNVRCHKIAQYKATESEIQTWLIDRCLAQGGSGLLVFLNPDDIIKPNFFQNVALRGFDNFVVQGYVALKNYPENPMEKVIALAKRLLNRVDNSGRYHMGLSCRLQNTGWAVKKEMLEMVPYRKGEDIDNLEYTIRLNLSGFRVTWAPNMVVYAQDTENHIDWISEHVHSFFNRLRILASYGHRLLIKAVTKKQLNLAQTFFSIVRPPHFITGCLLLVLGVMVQTGALNESLLSDARPFAFYFLTAGLLLLQTLALTVARCGFADYLVMFLWTPVAYLGALAVLPVSLFKVAMQIVLDFKTKNEQRQAKSYRQMQSTRFNEDMAPVENMLEDDTASKRVIEEILERNARHAERDLQNKLDQQVSGSKAVSGAKKQRSFQKTVAAPKTPKIVASQISAQKTVAKKPASYPLPQPKPETLVETAPSTVNTANSAAPSLPDENSQNEHNPNEQVQFIPLSNGSKQVKCVLKTKTTMDAQDKPVYQMVLEYKSLAFSTQAYRIKDQAFYELQSKVMERGLTLVSCGSCAYFYNPTADVPGTLKNCGVCLFGKTGRDVNLDTDAVTVVSKACDYHTSMNERETVVREWKESLVQTR